MYIINVLIEFKNINLDKTFEYYTKEKSPLYSRVEVDFNKRKVIGFVIKIRPYKEVDYEIKEIERIVDRDSIITSELFNLSKMMQTKYLCSQIEALQTILPSGLKPASKQKPILNQELYVRFSESSEKLTSKLLDNLNLIKNESNLKKNYLNDKYGTYSIKALIKKGYLENEYQVKKHVLVNEANVDFNKLNPEQEDIFQKIITDTNNFYLLHGITGSGKTEIYLHLAAYYLKLGKSVLVLVPEITLTLMMQETFAAHFKNNIAIIHSKLSNAKKYQEYQKILNGEVKIVVGTRSSIFAPLKNLGLIIIDEEHDNSYKQSSGLLYHTNDIAEYRALENKAKLVLGSATPSIVSLTKAYQKKYVYLTLNKRYNDNLLPKMQIVDLNHENLRDVVSQTTIKKIKSVLNKGKQVIILVNRRGYNTIVTCNDCHQNQMCPNCNVALTYHQHNHKMICHHCGYSTSNTTTCLYCGSTNLRRLGTGIQRIEEALLKELSSYRLLRIDQDTIKNVTSLKEKITKFKRKETDILIGTQMIAKGLDFKETELVVVLNIDASIAFNSYTAIENAFQLLVQVAGRAGRHSREGNVLVETFQPEHYVIKKAQQNDYLGFYETEMKQRKKYDNPPYYHIALIMLTSADEVKLLNEANNLYQYLVDTLKDVLVYNNVEHPIYKLANVYRQQIVIKYKDIKLIKDELYRLKKTYSKKKQLNISIDLDY